MKENLFWHDGKPLTSSDIIFTIQKIQDPETNSPLFPIWQGVAAQRLSRLELQLSLVNAYAFFSNILDDLYILPEHIFGEIPSANWRLSDFNLRPVGSGPYKFISFERQPNGFITVYKLAAWTDYHKDEALIPAINFNFLESTADLIERFNSGQIATIGGIEPQNLQFIERTHEIFVFELPAYFAVFLNQGKNLPLKELSVRQALDFAIDKNLLIKEVLEGYGRPAFGPIPQGTQYFNHEFENASSSQGLASSTLEEAGWELNKEGIRVKKIKKSTIPLEFTLSVPQVGMLTKTAEFLAGEWQKAGIKVNLQVLSGQEIQEAIKNRDYEALLFGNVLNRSFDLFSFWHSSERFHPGLNLALYNNNVADELIEAIRQNLDEASRRDQFRELQNLITEDRPAVFLFSPNYLYMANKNLRGVGGGFLSEPADRFAGTPEWYIKTARVLK
ncbi:MAG: ABC transporter substrate-binding protein [bacterium]